jgi:hypothetical protein
MDASTVSAVLSGVADLLAFAAIGAVVLWAVVRLRRISESARIATGIPIAPAAASSDAAAPTGARRLARASLLLASMFLFPAALYLSWRSIPQAFLYAELRGQISRARQMLLDARWQDPAMRCRPDIPIGIQLNRLFQEHEVFVLRVAWDAVLPRYELAVTGQANVARQAELQRVDLTIDLNPNGEAVLRSVEIYGEQQGVEPDEPGGRLLQKGCA